MSHVLVSAKARVLTTVDFQAGGWSAPQLRAGKDQNELEHVEFNPNGGTAAKVHPLLVEGRTLTSLNATRRTLVRPAPVRQYFQDRNSRRKYLRREISYALPKSSLEDEANVTLERYPMPTPKPVVVVYW